MTTPGSSSAATSHGATIMAVRPARYVPTMSVKPRTPEARLTAGGHRWRWQKRPHGAIEWVGHAPGQLGADGGTVTVSPPSPYPDRCPSCGRHAHLRVAFLALPVCSPFGPVGEGCSRG